MNLPDQLLPGAWPWIGHAALATIAIPLLRRKPWLALADAPRLNRWLGACVVLMAIWSVQGGIRPGLALHLLGATALTLAFGPALALLGLALVLAGVTLAGHAGWTAYSWNLLTQGVVPVAVSAVVYRVVVRYLPAHVFVYVFVTAFAGGGLALLCGGAASVLLLAAAGAYSWEQLARDYAPYLLLLAWGEALLSGMAITLAVAYRPQWLTSFDDRRYVKGK